MTTNKKYLIEESLSDNLNRLVNFLTLEKN